MLTRAEFETRRNITTSFLLAPRSLAWDHLLDLGRIRIEWPAQRLLEDPALATLYLGGRPSTVNRAAGAGSSAAADHGDDAL